MNHRTEAMIATRGVLSDAQLQAVASKFRDIDGVGQPVRSRHVPRVIWVSYQTGKIHALTILNQLTRLGFNASLVGM